LPSLALSWRLRAVPPRDNCGRIDGQGVLRFAGIPVVGEKLERTHVELKLNGKPQEPFQPLITTTD
jgi:hypothetical protein